MHARRLLRPSILFIAAIILFVVGAPFSSFAYTWKILPIGNSITDGKEGAAGGITNPPNDTDPGFRKKLYDRLSNAGIDFDFVGDYGTAPYEGHFQSGRKIEDFFSGAILDVDDPLAAYQPDIVLIHLGTNNISNDAGPYTLSHTMAGKLRQLIKQIERSASVQYILVSKIIPRLDDNYIEMTKVRDFNAEIEKMFFEGGASAKMVVVDMYSQVYASSNWLPDRIHPTEDGYSNIAEEYSDLVRLVTAGDASSPNAVTPRNDASYAVDDNTIHLEWYTPGDDNFTGHPNLYELRYTVDVPINSSNFSNGTLVSINRPGRNSSGSVGGTEAADISSGLQGGRTYYFAMRAWDAGNNASGMREFDPLVTPLDIEADVALTFVDEFDDAALPGWNAASGYTVSGGAMTNSDMASGWQSLAVLDSIIYSNDVEQVETSVRWMSGSNIDGVGIAMLLDNKNYSQANGYMVRVREGNVELWGIEGGGLVSPVISQTSFRLPEVVPTQGDTIKIKFSNNPSSYSFELSINDQAMGSVNDYNRTYGHATNLYSGLLLYGAYASEVDAFTLKIPHLQEDRMFVYGGDGQSGFVDSKLGSPLSVKIVDINGAGVPNVPVEFDVLQGSAFLSTDPDSICTNFQGNLWLESEEGILEYPMTIGKDTEASNSRYAYTLDAYAGKARYSVWVPCQGTYQLWMRVSATDGNSNSIRYAMDDTTAWTSSSSFDEGIGWYWEGPMDAFSMDIGFHTFYLKGRDANTKIDRILLTSNSTYTPTDKGGVSERLPNITDSQGIASTEVTFDWQAGPVQIRAYAETVPHDNDTLFSINANAGPPTLFEPAMDSLIVRGEAGHWLSDTFKVYLEDQYGNPRRGEMVLFEITSGDGSFSSGDTMKAQTDDYGVARALLKLGWDQETRVKAYVNDFPELGEIYFSGVADEGSLAKTVTFVEGNQQEAVVTQKLPTDLKVQVLNDQQLPVEKYAVQFDIIQGNGKLNGRFTSVIDSTDAQGYASVQWTLGQSAGVHKVKLVNMPLTPTNNDSLIFAATALPDAANKIENISGNNQTEGAGKEFVQPLRVRIVDQYNNGIANYGVRYTVVAGNGDGYFQETPDLRDLTVYTDEQGYAQVRYTAGRQTGDNQVKAEGVEVPQLPDKNFTIFFLTVDAAKPQTLVKMSGDAQQSTVTSNLASFVVKVLDPFGDPSPEGIRVRFQVTAGTSRFGAGAFIIDETSEEGLASAMMTLGYVAEAQEVQVTLPDYSHVEPIVFTALALPGAAAKVQSVSSVEFSGDVESTETLVVKVMDQYDNAKPGHSVYFDVEQGGTLLYQGNSIKTQNVASNDSGFASIVYKMGTNTSVLNRIKSWAKTPDGSVDLDGSPIYFQGTVWPGDPTEIVKVSGDNQTAIVMHQATDSLVVKLRDKYQNPVTQHLVRFTAKSHGSSINGQSSLSVKSNNSGNAGVVLTLGDRAGQRSDTLVVTVPGLDEVLPIEFYANAAADEPSRMSIQGDSTWQQQLGYSTPQVQPQVLVTDQFGNAIANHSVFFQVSAGGGGIGGKDTSTVETDLNGIAKVFWTLSTTPEQHQLSASSSKNGTALAGSPKMFTAITTAGRPETIVLIQPTEGSVQATANHKMLLKVRLVDHWNNPISMNGVTFTVEQPAQNKGVLVDDQGSESYQKQIQTDADGFAQIAFKPVINSNLVKISSDKGDGTKIFKYISVMGTAATAQRIEILTNKEISVVANSKVAVQVAAYDDTDALVDAHTITFTTDHGYLSSGGNYSTKQTQDGIAVEEWSVGSKTGRAVLKVDGNTPLGSPDSVIALIMPSAPFADSSRIELLSELIAEPAAKALVKISLSDSFGNPVNGYELLLTSDDPGVSFDQPTLPTDAAGVTYGHVSSSKAGIIRISAVLKIDPGFRIPPLQVLVGAGAPAKIKLPDDKTNQFVGNIGAALKEPLTVIVTDANDNPVDAREADVKFEIKNGGGYFEESGLKTATLETDSTGQASVNLILGITANQPYEIQAGVIYPQGVNAQLTFVGQAREPEIALPWSLTKVSGDSILAPVAEPMPEPFVVQVTDKDGSPVWSSNTSIVKFTVTNGSGSFPDGDFKSSDKHGHASAVYKMTGGGTHTIEAQIQGSLSGVQFTSFAQAGAPALLAPVDSVELHAVVGSDVFDRIKVQVMDENNIPTDNVPVTFKLVEQPAQVSGAEIETSPVLSGSSGIAGVAAAVVRLGHKTGDYVIKASSSMLPENESVIFRITAVHDDAYYLSKYSGDQQRMTFNRELNEPVVVKVMDKYENPTPNVSVYFYTEDAAAHGQPLHDYLITDENGMVENRWTIGSNRTNELIAQKIGLRPWPQSSNNRFVAFGENNNFPEFATMPTDTTILHSELFKFPLSAVDDDGDPLTYSITSTLPNGAYFDAASNSVFWTPTSGQKGAWTISYRVDDSRGGYGLGTTTVRVISQMRIYTFDPNVPFIKIPASGEQRFAIVVIDANGPVSYAWYIDDQLQPGSGSSLLIEAANYPLGGPYSVRVLASDGQTQVSHNWSVKVKVELASFEGMSVPFEGVVLDWETASEIDNIGFDVLRSSSKNGPFEKINGPLLTGSAGRYSFTDSTAAAGRTFFYKLEDVDRNGDRNQSESILVTVNVPKEFMLLQNYPNPFNPTTTIRLQLPKSIDTKLSIFNIRGQHVRTLLNRTMEPGYHRLMWNGLNDAGVQVSSGVYYYRLQAGDYQSTVKMLLLK